MSGQLRMNCCKDMFSRALLFLLLAVTQSPKPTASQQTARPTTKPEGTTSEPTTTPVSDPDNLNRFGSNQYGASSNVDRFTYFDVELLQRLHGGNRQKNLVISPASIKMTLGLILEGAEGKSANELSALLRLPQNKTIASKRLQRYHKLLENTKPNVVLRSGSRVLVHKNIVVQPAYKNLLNSVYSTEVANVNFDSPKATVRNVNNWVSNLTNGFIPEFLSEETVDKNAVVILLNAMYFKGNWEVPFDPRVTTTDCFYITKTECKKTKMMHQMGYYKYGFIDSLNAQVLEIPYNDDRYSLVILLPQERDGLPSLIRDLPYTAILPILNRLDGTEVTLSLPKFTIEYDVQLVPVLEAAGAKEVFSDRANLSSMVDYPAKVSAIFHKAKIEVNEKGTTAGAGTAGFVVPLMISEQVNFVADHPFLFFIRDIQSGFLFEGQFVSPDNKGVADEGSNIPLPEMSTRPPIPDVRRNRPKGGYEREPSRSPSYGTEVNKKPHNAMSRPYPLPPPNYRPDQRNPDTDALKFSK